MDVSFGSDGYALMTEEKLDQKIQSKRKKYASQNLGTHTDNTHWGDNILLGRHRQRTGLLHIDRWWRCDRRTNPWPEKQSQKKVTEWITKGEPSSRKPSIKEFTKNDRNTTSYMNGINTSARIWVEQINDLLLQNSKLKTLSQPHVEVLLTKGRQFEQYKALEDRLAVKDGLVSR